MDKNALIEHIKDKNQHLTMRRVLDKLERVVGKYSIEFTDFLDPYQRKLCYSFINRFQEVSFFEDGGLENSERKSIIIFPSYMDRSDVLSPIQALRIDGSFKFRELTHRDYLGAIMSLGIKREKIGDILIHKDYGNIITFKEIADYIKFNLDMINREPVVITEVESFELEEAQDDFIEKSLTLSSFRLDVFVSAICNLSREKSSSLIKNGYVKVNWQTIDLISKEVHENDMISIRGFGRTKVSMILGKTRKDRYKVVVKIIK
ncbi:YlmH/Sll1252 family protein [Proteiniborus sp. DW1]|uniref:YlmH family RNA-binding protein n=1 Tax=Proteiniborus sp. DW1 TaxID=1889883 RepID=UPI00190E7E69|nr:YlmH/Sll1252 family protein [Proteiniborus sp. DW1]